MARRTPLTRNQSSLIIHLEKCKLLRDLTPEQLGAMARHCRKDDIPLSKSRKLLDQYRGNIVFVIDGTFERIFLPTKDSIENPSMAMVLNEIKIGEIWGEQFLLTQKSNKIGLRSTGKGTLIAMNSSRFESYMLRWPELHKAVLMTILEKELTQSYKLGESLQKIHSNEIVLNRIEGVADLLIDYMAGEAEKDTVYQKRFIIPKKPDNIKVDISEIYIEQAYLHSKGDKEDRIRKEIDGGMTKFSRTTKIGKGLERKKFGRDILESEYNKLLSKKEGNVISKRRIKLNEKINKGEIVLDIFEGHLKEKNLKNLYIIEADFKTKKEASAFKLPNFLSDGAKDITEDHRFSNRELALKGRPDV